MDTKKFKTLEEALIVFERSTIEHGEATKEGNYRIGNKAYDNVVAALNFIKDDKQNVALLQFLKHDHANVRVLSAAFLLNDYNQQATTVLNEIEKGEDIFAFNARMVLLQFK